MKREWKPGDVAVRSYLGETLLSMRVSCRLAGHQPGEHWHHEDGGWDRRDGRSTYRPLVVIDPEDREQVERLSDLFNAEFAKPGHRGGRDDLQAALREFAGPKPPRPEEPTGLGAVVEDADGNHWVLYTHPDNYAPWCDGSVSCDYDEIAAVRVLSEGVRDA